MAANLDMWIADIGAPAQLFALDTVVSTPLITGTHTVPDPGINETFGIGNLDQDVVDILLGPSADGVVSIHDFFNNLDGTGSFQADFNPTQPVRYLAIIAIDDVDNQSNESPAFLVRSLEQSVLGETFSIRPQSTVSTPTCQSLMDAMPETEFILKRQYTVPYSFNPTVMELRAITPGEPVEITVVRRDPAGKSDETQRYVVIPDQPILPVSIRLGRGLNVVSAQDRRGRNDTIMIAATTYAAILCSYARQIYNYSQVLIEEENTAIYSPVSTRLAEALLPFADLLPDVKSQQTLATKLAVRALVGSPGKQSGVRDLLAALTLSTPIFVQEIADPERFEPAVRPLFNSQEAFTGVEAHVWPANQCIKRWLAFIRYLDNLKVFKLVEISEHEVVFYDENGDLQHHRFDFSADPCSLTTLALQSICFDNIDVRLSIFSESDLRICAATYPFDMRPTPNFPIRPVDHEDEIDPGFDGYVDFSATGRWDGGDPLDSQGASPAIGSGYPACSYPYGYIVRPLLMGGLEHQIDNQIGIDIDVDITPAVGAELEINIHGLEVQAGMDMVLDHLVGSETAETQIVIAGIVGKTVGLDLAIST